MKLAIMLLSLILGNTKNLFHQKGSALTEQIVLNVRSLAVIILSSIGALALFCCGFYMLLSHIATQWDTSGGVQMSATLLISGLLSFFSLATLIYCLRPETWLRATGFQQRPSYSSAQAKGPIETAVASLIMDFVHQREESRKRRSESSSN